jgi:hypothetical protein
MHPFYTFDIHKQSPVNREDFWLCDRYISDLDEAFILQEFWMLEGNYIGWTCYEEYRSNKHKLNAIFDILKQKDAKFNPTIAFIHFDHIKDLKKYLDKEYETNQIYLSNIDQKRWEEDVIFRFRIMIEIAFSERKHIIIDGD